MAERKARHEPIRQSVRVDCPIEDAFRLFTEGLAEWWPLGEEAETCAIEPWVGGRVLKSTRSGEEREWGAVTIWDPPRRVKFAWDRDENQTVEVEFRVVADGTQVTLIHRGWELAGMQTTALLRFEAFAGLQMVEA